MRRLWPTGGCCGGGGDTWSEMKEYCPFTKGLLSILTGINDVNLCRPFGLGIRFSTSLSDILCLRLAVLSTA
jgi:hypothetical protein